MLIDDDEIERLKFTRVCTKINYKHTIVTAENGEEAFLAIAKEVPKIILLDLNMPKMDGFEFLQKLRASKNGRNVPVVVLTAKILSAEEKAILQGSVEQVCSKQEVSVEQLVTEINGQFG